MKEKFIVTIYQKIKLNENIIIFRRAGIVKDVYIDMSDELQEIMFYDNNQKRITLECMENPYILVSDDAYCYGSPIAMSDLKKLYPNIKTEEELAEKYLNEVSKIVNIGIYNEEKDSLKILVTNEEILKKHSDDELFDNFIISYDSEEKEQITIESTDLEKILNLLDKGEYDKVKENTKELLENIHKIDHEVIPKENKQEKELNEILTELNHLVGLNNIKEEINKLLKYLTFRSKVKSDLNLEQPNLHMFFSGNPGTGKTTVARIIGDLLYKMGYIEKNTVAEITPKDLIAGYVGQTALKTAKFIEKNKGGVIFIDEAYVFAGNAQKFAEEALVEILKELEKNETVFIFAGYKDEMEQFMSINPGLTSRIGYYLEYKDYTEEELFQIFESKITKIGLKIDDNLKEKIKENLQQAINSKNFGNGRYIDKLINKLILEHSLRADELNTKEELITLTQEDWNQEIDKSLIFKTKTKKLGFQTNN